MEFKPTYLYIKQHSITKKCYFGKTTKEDPVKYLGSGKHWKAHIKIHGREFVETLWFKLFTDKEELVKVATLFSEQQDIVKSDRWLNLIPEDGVSSTGIAGRTHTEETKRKISVSKIGVSWGHHSEQSKIKISLNNGRGSKKGKVVSQSTKEKLSTALSGRVLSTQHIENMSKARIGHKLSTEHKNKLSIALKGKVQEKLICPHCKTEGGRGGMKRYHFSNCKEKS